MSSINVSKVTKEQHAELLSKFPQQWHIKLYQYTGEELFYFYKLCSVKTKKNGSDYKDMFFLSLKAKFYRYMEGQEKYPISGDAWIKLHHKFRYQFELYTGVNEEVFDLEEAKRTLAEEQRQRVVLDTERASAELANKFKRLA